MPKHEHTQKRMNSESGATVLELLLAGGLVFGVVFAFQLVFLKTNAASRDLQRIIDMREAENLFQQLFRTAGGYQAAAQDGGCSEQNSLLSDCNFARINAREQLRDPGDTSYRVTVVPNETAFEITFVLEQPHGTLAAGSHTLTPSGIR